jgi:hypothetical protein
MARFTMALSMAALVAKHQVRAFNSAGFQRTWHQQPTLLSRHQRGILFMSSSSSSSVNLDEINEKVKLKGDEIRQLKSDGIDKAGLAPHIEELKSLKSQLPADESAAPPPKKKKEKVVKEQKNKVPPAKKVEELSESELRLTRLAKVDAMREANVEPFEYTFDVTRSAAQLAAEYEGRLAEGEEDEESDVSVAGRIMMRRVFGKLAFFALQDGSGTVQLQFDKNRLGDAFKVSSFHVSFM